MPTPGTKEAASLHSTTPSHARENTATSRSPVEAPSPVAGGPVPAQDMTESGGMPEPWVHPMEKFSKDPQVQNMKASCNSCLMKVAGVEALGHLYFGNLKCANCLYVINQCRDFKTNYPPKEKCKRNNSHHVMTEWDQPVWTYLNYCARRNFVISRFCGSDNSSATMTEIKPTVASYLRAIKPLKDMEPWKNAFKDPQVKNIIDVSTPEAQINFAKKHERDKPAEHAVQQCTQLTTSVAQTAQISKLQEAKAQQKIAEGTYQKSTPPSRPLAQPTQTSKPQEAEVQQNKIKSANQHSTPLACSAAQTTQIVTRLKQKVQQKGTHKQSLPLTSSTAQTTQKLKLEVKKMQQSRTKGADQDSTPLTSPAAHVTQKSSPQKRKMQQESLKDANQQGVPLTSPAAQTTQKSSPQKRKIQQESSKSKNQFSQPLTSPAAHTAQKSSPQKKKVKQETQRSEKKDNKLLTSPAAQKSSPQKRKLQEKSPKSVKQKTSPASSSAAQTTQKSSPQKRKEQQKKRPNKENTPLASPAAQTTPKSKPQKTNVQQRKTKDAEQHSTSSFTSEAQTMKKSRLIKERITDLPLAKRNRLRRRRNMEYSKFIPRNVISSGHFLVVQFPGQKCPEECPECYCPFDPVMCSVNLSTFITDFTCPECYLSVYVVSKNLYKKSVEQNSADAKVDGAHVKRLKFEV